MSSTEPKLAYTVHHKGRKYRAGMTAEEIGDVAANFGAHVWEGGKGPGGSTPAKPDSGTRLGTPPVPAPSALPGAAPPAPAPEPGIGGDDGAASRRNSGGRRGTAGN